MAKLEIILSELKGHISFIEMGDEHSNAENEYFQMIDDCIEEAKVEVKELKADADAFEKKLVEHDDTIKRLSDELSKYKKSKIVKLMWWLK